MGIGIRNVGTLSSQEVKFLKDRGANVILAEGKNHGGAVGEVGIPRLKEILDIR